MTISLTPSANKRFNNMRILIDHYSLLLDARRCHERVAELLPMHVGIEAIVDVIGSVVCVFVICPPQHAVEVCKALEADGFEL